MFPSRAAEPFLGAAEKFYANTAGRTEEQSSLLCMCVCVAIWRAKRVGMASNFHFIMRCLARFVESGTF